MLAMGAGEIEFKCTVLSFKDVKMYYGYYPYPSCNFFFYYCFLFIFISFFKSVLLFQASIAPFSNKVRV